MANIMSESLGVLICEFLTINNTIDHLRGLLQANRASSQDITRLYIHVSVIKPNIPASLDHKKLPLGRGNIFS